MQFYQYFLLWFLGFVLLLLILLLFFREREPLRAGRSRGRRSRGKRGGRRKESQADFALSMEPNVGLYLMILRS